MPNLKANWNTQKRWLLYFKLYSPQHHSLEVEVHFTHYSPCWLQKTSIQTKLRRYCQTIWPNQWRPLKTIERARELHGKKKLVI